jgi:hypothetical protein
VYVEVDPVDGDEIAEALDQSAGMHKRQLRRCIHHPATYPRLAR